MAVVVIVFGRCRWSLSSSLALSLKCCVSFVMVVVVAVVVVAVVVIVVVVVVFCFVLFSFVLSLCQCFRFVMLFVLF